MMFKFKKLLCTWCMYIGNLKKIPRTSAKLNTKNSYLDDSMETTTTLTPLEGRTWPVVVINDTTNDGNWNLISFRVMFFAKTLRDIRTFYLIIRRCHRLLQK